MGTGLLMLATGSKENNYITKNPEITFFKIVYKRHSNFSIETIPQYFINPIDFGRETTLNISKNGDLINEIYLCLKLPNLNSTNTNYTNYNINYVNNLGYALIKKVELEISGTILGREYGEWLYIWNELITKSNHKKGSNEILGNTEKFTKPENKKDSLDLIIPLYFWFNKSSALSLPLISLSKDEVKIHIELNKLSDVIVQTPQKYIKIKEDFCGLKSGDYIYQDLNGRKNIGIFHDYDLINNLLYYNPLIGNFKYDLNNSTIYTDSNEIYNISETGNNIGNVGDYFNLNYPSLINGYCLINYIFLDNEERYLYLTKNHEYLVQVPQYLNEETFSSSNIKYNLHFSHPVSSIFFRVILEQNIINKNYFNYSKYPFGELTENLIKNIKIILNGQQMSNIDDPNFFNYLQNIKFFDGKGNKFINQYSYSINPISENQPYGSINFSKIDDAYLQLTLDGIINYQNSVRVKGYAINYNIFRIIDGIGKMVFSI